MATSAADFAGGAEGAAAAAAAAGDLATILGRLSTATTDASGRLRDAAGRFISMADQAKAASVATGEAAAALAKVSTAGEAAAKGAGAAAKAHEQGAAAAKKATSAADGAKGAIGGMGQSFLDSASSASRVPGPIGAIQDALSKLGPQGQAAAMALGVLTAAVTALTAAIVGGMIAAIGVVEKLQARVAGFTALAGGEAAGKAALATVARLSEILPFSTAQISQWSAALLAAGVPASKLEGRIKAIAAAEAIMREAGGGGGAAAEALFRKLGAGGAEADAFLKKIAKGGKQADALLKEMGLTLAELGGAAKVAKMSADQLADAVAKALQKKGKTPLDEMGGTIEVLAMKLKEGLLSLFDGLGLAVQPFMAAIKGLFGEFGKGGAITKALKPVITDVFSTLFAWATKAVSFIHSAFQQIVIAALKIRIALDPIISKIKEWAKAQDFVTGLKIAFLGLAVGITLAFLPLIVIGVTLALIGVAVVTFVTIALAAIGRFRAKVAAEWAIVKAVFKSISLPNLAAAASNMISSFTAAISAKIGAVVVSMRAMGAAAKSALFGALGIASPSKVAVEAAGNVTGSFANEVKAGTGETQAAFAGMAKVPPGAKPGAGGGGKGGATAKLAAAIERLANALEMSPTFREMLQAALDEAERSGDDMEPT